MIESLPKQELEKIWARFFVDLSRIEKGENPLYETRQFYEKYPLLKKDYDDFLRLNNNELY